MESKKAVESLKSLVENCFARKSPVDSDSLMIPAEDILNNYPEAVTILIDYFRKVPDNHELKEFLGSLIIFYDKTPYKDVFDYVAKCDPHILKDVQSDKALSHYKEAFFK